MDESSFAAYCNRFAGQTGWVVGRGPTRFRYEELSRAEGPIFFINDAVGQEKWMTDGHPAFFFAHDAAMECWLFRPSPRAIPVLIVDQPVTGPPERRAPGLIRGPDDPRLGRLPQAIVYRRDGPLDRATLLRRSREEIRRSGQLHLRGGTIHPLLHFAWYVGCAKLHLVGCDGLPGIGYDDRLENRSRSRPQGPVTIRVQQEEMLRQLALPREYLGTIPHRLRMIMGIRAAREHRGILLAWAGALLPRLRAAGCGELVVRDGVDRSKGAWIDGVWPNVDACVQWLVSSSHREAMEAARQPPLRDSGFALRVAYKAEPR